MPELDATQVLAAVTREQLPTLGVVVSGDLDGESVYRAVASGARGYLPKHLSRDEVRDAVAAVAHGETVLPGELQGSLMAAVRRHHPDAGAPLTKREREVLQLIAEGTTTPQIAARLHVSAATIRSHIQHQTSEAAYVFSGSHPGLMLTLFSDRERPLFGQARPIGRSGGAVRQHGNRRAVTRHARPAKPLTPRARAPGGAIVEH